MRLTQIFLQKIKDVGELTRKVSNLPDSYIKRSMEQVYWKNPDLAGYRKGAEHARYKFRFTTNRPWTTAFYMQNLPRNRRRKVFVEPIEDWSYFKGDRVQVLVGRDKGKQGFVSQVIQERNWVIVEGLNTHLRNMKGEEGEINGAVVQSEAPLLVTTDIQLVDPTDLQPTEFVWRFTEEGEKVRVSLRSGRVIPLPATAEETMDYKSKKTYRENDKDTSAADASSITFQPKLKTFEMEIMDEMGIVEDRIPKKTYWY